MTDLQKQVAKTMADRETAKKAERDHRDAVADAQRVIRNDDSLSAEVRDFKEGCLSAHLDAGGDLGEFAAEWPELRRRWIVSQAAGRTEAAVTPVVKHL